MHYRLKCLFIFSVGILVSACGGGGATSSDPIQSSDDTSMLDVTTNSVTNDITTQVNSNGTTTLGTSTDSTTDTVTKDTTTQVISDGTTTSASSTNTDTSIIPVTEVNTTDNNSTLGTVTDTVTSDTSTTDASLINLAKLSWTIPTTRSDESPLTLSEIAGYRVYMGSDSVSLRMIVDLNDGSTTTYTVSGLNVGTHYFAVTTYDTNDNESSLSNVVAKTIR
jgi:hypothetical protein